MRKRLGSEEIASAAYAAGMQFGIEIQASYYSAERNWPSVIHDGGISFEVLGDGGFRVALLGPDGIVYKALLYGAVDEDHVEEEIRFFRDLETKGDPLCPDFCLYPGGVVAMPRYRMYLDAHPEALKDEDPYTFHPDHDHLFDAVRKISADVKPFNTGVRDDGSFVMIDGGCSFV